MSRLIAILACAGISLLAACAVHTAVPAILRSQLATSIACDQTNVVAEGQTHWHVSGCGEAAVYLCGEDAADPLCSLVASSGSSTKTWQTTASTQPPPRSGDHEGYVPPASPSNAIVPPGSYNPRTGAVQHSYSWQYTTPPSPPPPPLPTHH